MILEICSVKIWKRPSDRRCRRFCGGRKRTVLGKMRKNYIMKKIISLLLALTMALGLAACGGAASSSVASSAEASSEAVSEAASSEETASEPLSATEALRIAGLKGPTTMGLVNLLSMEADGTASMDYDLQLYGAADEIVPLLMKGELDMAAIPANLAATLYQKTSGGIEAVAVNTLGVLYVVEKGDTVQSMADLKGRTILSTGKGTTPEYVLRYLLTQNGIDPDKDVTIEYYSEATEVTAQMANTEDAIAVLPQPYVTAAGLQDDTLRVALNLTEEWNKVCDTQLITGVTVVRKEYAEEHPDVVAAFLSDYAKSVDAANTDLDGTAALCEEQGVVAKAAIAKKALPNCNIVCLTGDDLKTNASAYLQVLFDADPAAVGGAMPGDDFYWSAE
jgi:NitT/TauT family transport system substrate-binding protein